MTTEASPSAPHTDESYAVGQRLVALCQQGKNLDAINELYAANVVSVEVCGSDTMPREMKGIDAVRQKNQWWVENHEVHSGKTEGPYPHGDRFITIMDYDVTPTSGPFKGKRMQLKEAGLYTVANGKIVREEFFYHMDM